jgi:aryl-alcohol dehydrogenase-like predicted oxidoreductase
VVSPTGEDTYKLLNALGKLISSQLLTAIEPPSFGVVFQNRGDRMPMERRIFGWTGEKISPLILGSWEFGASSIVSEEQAVRVIRKAIELGIDAIDTAEGYGAGLSERIIGRAIKGYRRDEIFITTKVSYEHLRYDDVLKAADASLKRLETGYIDLYLIHWPHHYIPLRETLKAMERLWAEGKIRYIGVSNFPLPMLRAAREYLSRTDIATNQVHYNILYREIEKELLPYMVQENIAVQAYDPLALGFLIGRREIRDEYRWYRLARPEVIEAIQPLVNEIRTIASELGKTPAQVVLNWLLIKDNVFPVFNTTKEEHLQDNIGSIGWRLSGEHLERIDRVLAKIHIEGV